MCVCHETGFNCDQGRQCPYRMPAEACTDVGADDAPRPPMTRRDMRTVLLIILAPWAVVIFAVWAWLAYR